MDHTQSSAENKDVALNLLATAKKEKSPSLQGIRFKMWHSQTYTGAKLVRFLNVLQGTAYVRDKERGCLLDKKAGKEPGREIEIQRKRNYLCSFAGLVLPTYMMEDAFSSFGYKNNTGGVEKERNVQVSYTVYLLSPSSRKPFPPLLFF